MKKVKRIFGMLFMFLLLGVVNPTIAQTGEKTTATTRTTTDDDSSKWGLAGLLGLLGLLGLRKKDDDTKHRTTVNR